MKYTYIIASHEAGYLPSPNEGIKADFKNPVSKGELVFWSLASGDLNGSYAGRVVDVEHRPNFSVIWVEAQ